MRRSGTDRFFFQTVLYILSKEKYVILFFYSSAFTCTNNICILRIPYIECENLLNIVLLHCFQILATAIYRNGCMISLFL